MPSGSNASRKVRSVACNGDEMTKTTMKRARRVSCATDSSTDSSQEPKSKKRFVGVRQRPSGRWVAEIKDTTQKIRIWLGTFDSAEEGALAYDNAARALRGANTRTNFVPTIEATTVPSKAARLIRLRQTAMAASSKTFTELGRRVQNQPACDHAEETSPGKSSITSESNSDDAASSHSDDPASSPCATNRADAEAASSAEESNEILVTGDAESPSVDDEKESPIPEIPWPDFVLMDGLDVFSCETCTTSVYPSFDFSQAAMDHDSEHYLSDESSEFLLNTLNTNQSDELPQKSLDTGQADQALWSSMDLPPLCPVS